ncbi:hypothetical protein [Bradyrhizobium ottawaense]|uniref:hypothetical protein n=1 Tax=Bradyrhizobium ottawaense TaxID=931866 RepID=UPI003FA11EB6
MSTNSTDSCAPERWQRLNSASKVRSNLRRLATPVSVSVSESALPLVRRDELLLGGFALGDVADHADDLRRTHAARDDDPARAPNAIIELTGLRTPCVLIDRFRAGLKRHVLSSAETGPPFKCGVLGVVRAGGAVAAGDRAGAPPVHLF